MIINQRKKVRLPGKFSKKPFPIGKVIYYFVLLIFIVSIFYILFFSPLLAINKINILGEENLTQKAVADLAKESLQGKYFNLVKRNNIALIGRRNMENLLKENFGRIESVKVEKEFPSAISIFLEEKELMFFVCSGEKCLIVDRKGDFNEEKDFRRDKLNRNDFVILNDLSGSSIDSKEDIMEQNYIDFVSNIRNSIKLNLDIDISNIYETPSRVSSDVRVTTMAGWRIFFNKDIEIKKSLNILKFFMKEKLEDGQIKNLEYVDLRASNKVYYKFKEGLEIETENKTEEIKPDVKKDEAKKKK